MLLLPSEGKKVSEKASFSHYHGVKVLVLALYPLLEFKILPKLS